MKKFIKPLAVLLLAGAIAGTLAIKERAAEPAPGSTAAANAVGPPTPGIPRLVDLGADQCVPCKAMAPILAALKEDYAGRMAVEFIDVWKNPKAGETYGVRVIPTQIFYAASGKELHRHEGFMGREDILATWDRLGVALDSGPDSGAR